jgi:hypothetical protein
MIEAMIVIEELPEGVSMHMQETKRENATDGEQRFAVMLDACLSASLNFIMERQGNGQLCEYRDKAAFEAAVKKFLRERNG